MTTRSGAPATNAVTAVVLPVPKSASPVMQRLDVDTAAHVDDADAQVFFLKKAAALRGFQDRKVSDRLAWIADDHFSGVIWALQLESLEKRV